MCFLPNDLKDFYLTTDGILIQWSIEFDSKHLSYGYLNVVHIGIFFFNLITLPFLHSSSFPFSLPLVPFNSA